MIDVMEYIVKREEQLDPPRLLSREDMVVLALADDSPTPGFCDACDIPVGGNGTFYRWCPECSKIASRFKSRVGMQRFGMPHVQKRCKCGAPVLKGNNAHRCNKCQHESELAYRRKWYANSQREAMV